MGVNTGYRLQVTGKKKIANKMLSAPILSPADTKILVLLSASVEGFVVSRVQGFGGITIKASPPIYGF